MPECFLEPGPAAVVFRRINYGVGIAVRDISLSLCELLEVLLDVTVFAVVVVASDPSDTGLFHAGACEYPGTVLDDLHYRDDRDNLY